MALSSDPNAWLYPIFAKLRRDPTFGRLSAPHQFERLCDAVSEEQPGRAAEMREWSVGGQIGTLKWLTDVTDEIKPQDRYELWRVRKGERELSCCVVYLPTGGDVRLMEGDMFRRTQLCRDAPEVQTLAEKWRAALLDVGWTTNV